MKSQQNSVLDTLRQQNLELALSCVKQCFNVVDQQNIKHMQAINQHPINRKAMAKCIGAGATSH